jgi:transposase
MLDRVALSGNVGRPRKRPRYAVADKGYSSESNRRAAVARGIIPNIARRVNQTSAYVFDKELYRNRNVVEREIGWLKESRSIGTRYEKTALNFLGLVVLACIQQYLKLLEHVV